MALGEFTALDAARRIGRGQLTSEALTRCCLDRIAERETEAQAWEYFDADRAIAQAQLADRSPVRGPLHGVPLAVKDVIDTMDMPTAYGSRIYQGHRPASDAVRGTCPGSWRNHSWQNGHHRIRHGPFG